MEQNVFSPKRPPADKRLGIYVHVPFCRSKCQYCDFYSLGGSRDKYLVDGYLQALATHIRETGARCPEHVVDTVYFGGGTPSFFGADNLRRIFSEIQNRFRVARDAEVTYEANPDSITPQQLRRLHSEGFNRISIGVQSDDDEMLKKLGRPHNYEQAVSAVEKARAAGFENLSLDLMYGLPNQTQEQWEKTLTHVLELAPEHMSCYGLKVEEGTPLWEYRDCANLPDDDAQADMYLFAVEALDKAGYGQYEISNFAKPGRMSRHNLKYWLGEEYLGFGPAAASDFGGMRYTIKPDLHAYIDGVLHGGPDPLGAGGGSHARARGRICDAAAAYLSRHRGGGV
jgi:oxygen-independent coproporphyrinogen-3 oxidase